MVFWKAETSVFSLGTLPHGTPPTKQPTSDLSFHTIPARTEPRLTEEEFTAFEAS